MSCFEHTEPRVSYYLHDRVLRDEGMSVFVSGMKFGQVRVAWSRDDSAASQTMTTERARLIAAEMIAAADAADAWSQRVA